MSRLDTIVGNKTVFLLSCTMSIEGKSERKIKIVFLHSLTSLESYSIENILEDKRLLKYLWVECILNPYFVKRAQLHIKNQLIADTLTHSLSWYLGFKWFLPRNEVLEDIYEKGLILPFKITNQVYRKGVRQFLKGAIHVGLC